MNQKNLQNSGRNFRIKTQPEAKVAQHDNKKMSKRCISKSNLKNDEDDENWVTPIKFGESNEASRQKIYRNQRHQSERLQNFGKDLSMQSVAEKERIDIGCSKRGAHESRQLDRKRGLQQMHNKVSTVCSFRGEKVDKFDHVHDTIS